MDDANLKAGWLDKRGKKFKKFHRRFIVIRRTGEIICYHDQHGNGKKVLLRLKKRLGSVEAKEGSNTDFTVSRGKHYSILRARTKKDRDLWVSMMQGIIDGTDLDRLQHIDRKKSHTGKEHPLMRQRSASEMTASQLSSLELAGTPPGSKSFSVFVDVEDSASTSASASQLEVTAAAAAAPSVPARIPPTSLKTASELRDEQKRMEDDLGVLTPRTTELTDLDRKTVQQWCNDPLHEHAIPLPKVALRTASLIEIQFERIRATLKEISKNLRKFANKGDDPTPIIIADQECQQMVRHLASNLRVHLDPSSVIGQFLESSGASKSTSKGGKHVVDFEKQHMAAISPNSLVIYMLTPSSENIDLLLRDFTRPVGPGIKVALSFTSNCAPELLHKLTRCKYLRARLVQAPMVMYNNFLAVSQESVSLGLPHAFSVMYSPMDGAGRHKLTDACVAKMVSVCASLNDYPQIRFAVTGMNCGMVAAKFFDAYENFLKHHASFEFHGMADLDNRSTMLILERNIDLCQPLMHGTCLQPFINDYLPMESRVPVPMCMSEADSVWPRFKHCRVWDVKERIEAELKKKGKDARKDPDFQSLAGILRLINESLDEVDDTDNDTDNGDLAIAKLKQLVMLEQSLVTGVEWLGRDRARVWDKTHQSSDVLKVAIDENTSNQLRLIALMMLSYRRLGVDRDAVLTAKSCLQVPEERFTSIQKLMEVPPPMSLSPDPQSDVKERRSMDVGFAKGCVNGDAALDINFPAIAQITDQFVRDVLPDDEFPSVQKRLVMPPSPPATAAVPTSFRAYMRTRDAIPDAKDKPVLKGGRFYVVVLGGATDTERRYISEISRHSGREIILVSTSFPTPTEYMENAGRIQLD